jgi:4-carboxymuconolactone decarboxylase
MVGGIQLSIMTGGALSGFLLDHFSAAATFIGGSLLLGLATVTVGKGDRVRPKLRAIALALAIPILVATSWAQKAPAKQERNSKTMQPSDVINVGGTNLVAPALDKYAHGPVAELWNGPGLSRRDRSMITLEALIARNQTIEMAQYMNLALDSGLKPREISEMITHLAFYSGWSNAIC